MTKLTTDIVYDEDLYSHIAKGVEALYRVAKAAYGPGAGNAIIELPYGDPIISRDGATNLERVRPAHPVERAAARIVNQSSKQSNKKVGDGTTAVVILAYHLYQEALKMLAAGHNRMAVARMLEQTAVEVIAQLDKMKVEVNAERAKQVAIVSAGDEAIGNMIADVIANIGIDGGITVEDFEGSGIYNEIVDGFYFRRGFTNVNLTTDPSNLESKHQDVDILITEKRMATAADIAPLLDKVVDTAGKGKQLILIGDVSEEVVGLLLLNRLKGIINVTVADIPVFGAFRSLVMEDLALVTGGTVYTSGANPSAFNVSMLGSASRVVINEFSTTIIGGDAAREDVEHRIDDLREQLKTTESTAATEALKDRIARLSGKVAIIRVGGSTGVEQGEVKLRVQDAICAVQAAIRGGIVPGGGVALTRVTAPFFQEAFKQPFMCLVENCGYNKERALWGLQNVKKLGQWYGYDLKSLTFGYTPISTLDAGIVDPALVVKETVKNATSVIAKLITGQVGIMLADREDKHD